MFLIGLNPLILVLTRVFHRVTPLILFSKRVSHRVKPAHFVLKTCFSSGQTRSFLFSKQKQQVMDDIHGVHIYIYISSNEDTDACIGVAHFWLKLFRKDGDSLAPKIVGFLFCFLCCTFSLFSLYAYRHGIVRRVVARFFFV